MAPMVGLGLLQYYGYGSLLFYFHSQGQHNKLERDRVNQSEGRLPTRRFSVRLLEIEGLFTDRTVFYQLYSLLDWTG
jgi:hypothetical protein